MFSRFDIVPAGDRQTYGRTERHICDSTERAMNVVCRDGKIGSDVKQDIA